jgi:hypothetical protein
VNTIVLAAKGEIKKARVSLPEAGKLTLEAIHAYMKKKSAPTEIGSYNHEGGKLYVFGYTEGKTGTENKHSLPPPYADKHAYGDILLIASAAPVDWSTPSHFTESQWETFYEGAMGAFDTAQTAGGAATSAASETPLACDDEDDLIGADDDEEDAGEVVEDGDDVGVEDEGDGDCDDARSQGSAGGSSALLGGDDDEEEKPIQRAPAKKKKSSSSAALSGYQHQMTLLTNPAFSELTPTDPLGDSIVRQTAYTLLQFIETLGFTSTDRATLEASIYAASFVEADRRKVICHWNNPLFKDIYNMILRTTVANLHPASPVRNPRLLMRIRAGEVLITDIPAMNEMEIFPENWRTLIERQSLREQRILEGDKGMATDRFRCSRCHKKECTYYEMQTRSADEPMTIFITCLNCGKRWRQ